RDTWRSLRKLRVGDLKELVETRVAVGMQCAGEVGQFLAAVLAFAVCRVAIEHGGGCDAGVGGLVAQIYPQPPGLGLAGARREHRNRRVVAMGPPTPHDMGCGP